MDNDRFANADPRKYVGVPLGTVVPDVVGFFPVLFDGHFMELLATSRKDHPKQRLSQAALDAERSLAFESLAFVERRWEANSHDTAKRIAREAIASGRPLGVYLRKLRRSRVQRHCQRSEWK